MGVHRSSGAERGRDVVQGGMVQEVRKIFLLLNIVNLCRVWLKDNVILILCYLAKYIWLIYI